MYFTKRSITILLGVLLCASFALAQDNKPEAQSDRAGARDVTVIIQRQQLRFTSQSSTQDLRLEVFGKAGESVYDSGLVAGAELSWALRNASGGDIPSGLYAYTLTIKDANSETPETRRGHLILERGRDQLWVTSEGAIGAEESLSGGDLTVSSGPEASVAGARIGGSGASVVAQVQPPLCLFTPSGCHDASLTGEGTIASPLGIANGGVTGPKIAAGQVVKSLNGLFDNVTLSAGSNITITPSGNILNIAAPGLLGSVTHDSTLVGNGTGAAPLGVAVPLNLSGSTGVLTSILKIVQNGHGSGLSIKGGTSPVHIEAALISEGGDSPSSTVSGGRGISARGGSDNFGGFGGAGIL
ncbi:MAG TPA: hypothetical protein VJ810_08220, partial [Blastocatellia bacterium]|nr:hypothetical protein [Blastocatellia bacterium]